MALNLVKLKLKVVMKWKLDVVKLMNLVKFGFEFGGAIEVEVVVVALGWWWWWRWRWW